MTNHLPECPTEVVYDITSSPLVMTIYDELHCICDRLRACEKRIREEESRNVIGSVSLAAIGEANLQQYQLGFATALDAARDAVAALIDPEFHWASATIGECGMHAGREQALAAIDALREEQK